MLHAIFKKLAELGRRHIGTRPCPEIRWDEVVRIEALGTDGFGVFEVWLVIFHNDGTEAGLHVEDRGYDKILESLPLRFPSIPSTWYGEMAETPWDVKKVLYSKSDPVA